MPLPNEHSCRIADPSEFQEGSFRRIHLGSGVDAIIGKRPGKDTTETQAMRYPTSSFTAAEARAHCERHKGRFTPAGSSD
jgi:hypothetical protein